MKLLQIHIKDYCSIGEIKLRPGDMESFAVGGDNGNGKSAFVEAAYSWCPFGKTRADRDAEVVRTGATHAYVEGHYLVGDGVWKIVRRCGVNGGLDLQLFYRAADAPEDAPWEDHTGKTALRGDDTTQSRILRALGVTYDILSAGPLAMQDDTGHFTETTAGARRTVLGRYLDLEEYRTLAARASKEGDAALRQAQSIADQLDREGDYADRLAEARTHQRVVSEACSEARAALTREEEAEAAARAQLTQSEGAAAQYAALTTAVEERRVALTRSEQALQVSRADVASMEAVLAPKASVEATARQLPERETEFRLANERLKLAREAQQRHATLVGEHRAAESELRTLQQEHDRSVALVGDLEEASARADQLSAVQRQLDEATSARETAQAAVRVAVDQLQQLSSDPAVKSAAQAMQAAQEALDDVVAAENLAGQKQHRTLTAVGQASNALDEASRELQWKEEARDEARRRSDLLATVPCTRAAVWTPDDATTPCALQDECALLSDARTAQQSLPDHDAQIAQAQAYVEACRQAWDAARDADGEAVRAAAAAADARVRQSNVYNAAKAAYESALDAAKREAQARISSAQQDVQDAQGRYDLAYSDLRDVEQALTARTKLDEARARVASLGRDITEVSQRVSALQTDLVRMVREEVVPIEPLARAVEVAGAAVAESQQAATRLEHLLTTEARLEAVRASIAAHEVAHAEAVSSLQAAQGALDGAGQAPDVATAQRALDAVRVQRAVAQTAYDDAVRAVGSAESRVTQYEEVLNRHAALRAEAETLREQGRLYNFTKIALETAIAIQVDNAIPRIERAANDVLSRLSDRGMSVRLETQREKRDGKGVIETLDLIVGDRIGERPYKLLSGSEKFRVSVALRIGLTRVLQVHGNYPITFFVLDEGQIGSVTEEWREAFADVIAELQQDYQVILVTHFPDVAAVLPQQVMIHFTDNGSYAEVSG